MAKKGKLRIIDHIDYRFEILDDKIGTSTEKLEAMMVEGFGQIHKRLDDHDEKFEQIDSRFDRVDSEIYEIKEDIRKIEGHIGIYEIRAQNIEQILLQDHKPRIAELERIAFA